MRKWRNDWENIKNTQEYKNTGEKIHIATANHALYFHYLTIDVANIARMTTINKNPMILQ